MRRGLGRKRLKEARDFYHDYLDVMYGKPDDDDDEEGAPFDSETITGELT